DATAPVTPSAILRGTVKVVDFGLTPLVASPPVAPRNGYPEPKAGEWVLDPADFAAPEQHVASAVADLRTVVYRLGCILFFMLAGRPLFRPNATFPAQGVKRRPEIPPALPDPF